MSNPSTIAAEPEEGLESALCAILAATCSAPVEGALAPATQGTAKTLSDDTFISVSVDQSSQDGDYAYRAPLTFSARIAVRYALADDASGSAFRDECRRVRAALITLTGDGCTALSSTALACDAFTLDSTNTSFEGEDNPTNLKSYTATIKCRILNSNGGL